MKPNLTSNHILLKIIKKNNTIIKENQITRNTFFFNFLFFGFVFAIMLFLLFIYFDKKKVRKNKKKNIKK